MANILMTGVSSLFVFETVTHCLSKKYHYQPETERSIEEKAWQMTSAALYTSFLSEKTKIENKHD